MFDVIEPDVSLSKCERLVERTRRLTPNASVYLAGTGFPAYFDRTVWPSDLELRVQILPTGLYSGTILQLIARRALPQEVASACSWEPLHAEDNPGRRAACG